MFRKKCLKYDIPKRKDLPQWNFMRLLILPFVWVWVSDCLAVYLCPHSNLKTHPFFSFHPHLLRNQNCIYMQVFQIYHFHDFKNLHTVYKLTKRFRGRQFQGEITQRDIWWESQRKFTLLTARTYWSRGNALVLKSKDIWCSSSSLSATYIFFLFFFTFEWFGG